jgi:hypothetical protein
MATYKPRIVKTPEGLEQQYAANIVYVGTSYGAGIIALGELKPERGKELKFGTPIHSLVFQTGKGELTVELNSQGNQRSLDEIERIGLSPRQLCVVYVAKRGPRSGRVALGKDIEVFAGKDPKAVKLGAVRVAIKPTPAQLKRITSLLRAAARDKLVLARYSPMASGQRRR